MGTLPTGSAFDAAVGSQPMQGPDPPASHYAFSPDDAGQLLTYSTFIFLQQVGFAVLESGSVRAKNVRNILLHNIIDKLICGVCYWALGFAFAYGDTKWGIIGTSNFFLGANFSRDTALLWFTSFMFLLTATTVVSGSLAERAQFEAYVAYAPLMAVVVYPLVVHWAVNGWLTTFAPKCIYLDFAGGSTVHLLGGVAGLVGAWMTGPRLGRFNGPEVKPIVGHNVESIALGTFLLWMGWYGFNIAPAYLRGTERSSIAARAAVNTTLCGCASALTALAATWWRSGLYDLRVCCNAILAGMVAITAICPHVDPWGAFLLGVIAGLVYLGCSKLLLHLRIDDPLEACAVHGGCSLVGILGVGFLARPDYIQEYRGTDKRICGGIFYAGHDGWQQLGVQALGAVVIIVYTGACSLALFGALHRAKRLRVDQATEIAGIDNIDHRGPAYPDFVIASHE
ncbi:hypothetical protein WJX81_005991 [Elliptochloris bilobata]|uniref:Ammonium transporter n=1 Tax=Elliptochloris bilobata TaxID=381761 RepID=A0AAW1RTY4_9CHLO